MTLGAFKSLVVAFSQRDATLFNAATNGVDILLESVNHAKLWAQRVHDFERLKASVDLVINKDTGGDLANAVLSSDSITVTEVKKVRRCFLQTPTSLYPIDLYTRDQYVESIQRKAERRAPDPSQRFSLTRLGPNYFTMVQHGTRMDLYPWDTTILGNVTSTTVTMDVIKWLPDYTADGNTDLFLDKCRDWLLYRTFVQLNFFLKDDDRIPINGKLIDDAWESVKLWDAGILDSDNPVTLD